MIFTISLCFIFSSIWGVCFHPPLYFIYCSLEQSCTYFFLSRGTNCAGFQGVFGEKQAMAACRSTEETQLHPYLEMFVLINLRCISDLLNWEIQTGEKTGPCFIHAVVSSNEQLRNKPTIRTIKCPTLLAGSCYECRQALPWMVCSLDRCCYGEGKE